MTKRTERIAFYATPSLRRKLEELAQEKSLSQSEIVRRGTLKEMESLGMEV